MWPKCSAANETCKNAANTKNVSTSAAIIFRTVICNGRHLNALEKCQTWTDQPSPHQICAFERYSQPSRALSLQPDSFYGNKQLCGKNTNRAGSTNWLRLMTETASADKSHKEVGRWISSMWSHKIAAPWLDESLNLDIRTAQTQLNSLNQCAEQCTPDVAMTLMAL